MLAPGYHKIEELTTSPAKPDLALVQKTPGAVAINSTAKNLRKRKPEAPNMGLSVVKRTRRSGRESRKTPDVSEEDEESASLEPVEQEESLTLPLEQNIEPVEQSTVLYRRKHR